jgi:hypothetical protein
MLLRCQFTRNQNADPTIVVFVYDGPLAAQATSALGGLELVDAVLESNLQVLGDGSFILK